MNRRRNQLATDLNEIELAFWLFLLHQGPGKREWFESWEFRVWYLGTLVPVFTHGPPIHCSCREHGCSARYAIGYAGYQEGYRAGELHSEHMHDEVFAK